LAGSALKIVFQGLLTGPWHAAFTSACYTIVGYTASKHAHIPEMQLGGPEIPHLTTSPLVPWNTCGAYHAGVLGVATGAYLPYCFFNLLSPVMTILFAVFNIKIRKYSHQELQEIRGLKEFS
jgi:hypothetical protein